MRVNPKIKNMTKEELKAWNEKLVDMEQNNINRDLTNKVRLGRGWIF